MSIPRAVAICIPVRNERRNLPGLFTALARLRGIGQAQVAMVFDGCADGSEALAVASAGQYGIALTAARLDAIGRADAGRARQTALMLGARLVGEAGQLLTTDADTRPHRDWLVASRDALDRCDLVCGRIELRLTPRDHIRRDVERYLDRLHAVLRAIDPIAGDAVPSHWHTGGASLAMTAAAWRAIGVAPLPATGEDGEIVRRARLAGLRVRQDPAVRVRTSARRRGRAADGLADALRRNREEQAMPLMEHPGDVVARTRRMAIARRAHGATPAADRLAAALGLAPAIVERALAAAPSADAFVTSLDLTRAPHRALPLPEAAILLARYEHPTMADAA